MKKLISCLLAAVITCSVSVTAFATDVWIEKHGQMTKAYGDIFVNEDGRTMVPLRAFAETFGANIEYYEAENSLGGKDKCIMVEDCAGQTHVFMIGNTSVMYGATRTYEMDTAPVIVNDRTYIPLRYAVDLFDYDAYWVGEKDLVECYHK